MFSVEDHQFMMLALRLAERGLYTTDPNPRVGCVIVAADKIVGQGWHHAAGEPHAEVHALQQAGAQAHGATAYVTLEPCSHHGRTPPCANALIAAGVARVVVAMQDPNPKVSGQGAARLEAAGIKVETGLMSVQAEALNPGFISRFRYERPFVRCKLAMSLDGRTALANGESKWITSAASRADVQRLRARSSVIVTGIGTVLADNPRMNARVEFEARQPDRVVLDSRLRMPVDAAMLAQDGLTWLAHDCQDQQRCSQLEHAGARLLDIKSGNAGLDLHALLNALCTLEYNEVLVEAGPGVSGAFLQADLVDELIVYMAPHLLGSDGYPLLDLTGINAMQDRIGLQMTDQRQIGDDLRMTFIRGETCLQES